VSERDGFDAGVPCWVDPWQDDPEAGRASTPRCSAGRSRRPPPDELRATEVSSGGAPPLRARRSEPVALRSEPAPGSVTRTHGPRGDPQWRFEVPPTTDTDRLPPSLTQTPVCSSRHLRVDSGCDDKLRPCSTPGRQRLRLRAQARVVREGHGAPRDHSAGGADRRHRGLRARPPSPSSGSRMGASPTTENVHVAFTAPDRATVDASHAAALEPTAATTVVRGSAGSPTLPTTAHSSRAPTATTLKRSATGRSSRHLGR
jgi:hypothetical protein